GGGRPARCIGAGGGPWRAGPHRGGGVAGAAAGAAGTRRGRDRRPGPGVVRERGNGRVRRLGVVGNPEYPGLAGVLEQLCATAPTLGLEAWFERDLAERYGGTAFDDAGTLDVLVTLGGDGTLLRGARLLAGREIPI